jgi:hypothetical protein
VHKEDIFHQYVTQMRRKRCKSEEKQEIEGEMEQLFPQIGTQRS